MLISSNNKYVKYIKKLKNSKFRIKEKKFVIEGIHLLEEAKKSCFDIEFVLYNSKWRDSEIIKSFNSFEVEDCLFKEISFTQTPQGILAIAHFSKKKLEDLDPTQNCIFLVLDNIQDPGNLGTIIRLCDAFKVEALILTNNCCNFYNPKVIRSSSGSIFHLPVIEEDEEKLIDYFKKNSIKIIGTSIQSKTLLFNIDLTKKIALIFGNESKGISKIWIKNADILIKIPLFGKIDSLNVATSSSICLYEVQRQRLVKKEGLC